MLSAYPEIALRGSEPFLDAFPAAPSKALTCAVRLACATRRGPLLRR